MHTVIVKLWFQYVLRMNSAPQNPAYFINSFLNPFNPAFYLEINILKHCISFGIMAAAGGRPFYFLPWNKWIKTECFFLNVCFSATMCESYVSRRMCLFDLFIYFIFFEYVSSIQFNFHTEQGLNWHKQMVKMTITFWVFSVKKQFSNFTHK